MRVIHEILVDSCDSRRFMWITYFTWFAWNMWFTSIQVESRPFTSTHVHSRPLTSIHVHSRPLTSIHVHSRPLTSIQRPFIHVHSFASIHSRPFTVHSTSIHVDSPERRKSPQLTWFRSLDVFHVFHMIHMKCLNHVNRCEEFVNHVIHVKYVESRDSREISELRISRRLTWLACLTWTNVLDIFTWITYVRWFTFCSLRSARNYVKYLKCVFHVTLRSMLMGHSCERRDSVHSRDLRISRIFMWLPTYAMYYHLLHVFTVCWVSSCDSSTST